MTTSPTEGRRLRHRLTRRRPGNGPPPGRAMIFGTGLIGGSVGMALRDQGWHVSGVDTAAGVAARAVELGALSEEGIDHRGRPGGGGHPGATPPPPSHRARAPIGDSGTPRWWSPTWAA